jgi:uncharacterized membrane protein
MTDIVAIVLSSIRLIAGLAFLLFIPGFAVLLVFYPKLSDISFFERIALSSIVSISAGIGVFLLLDLLLGIETTPVNSFLSLFAITVIALAVWRIEIFFMERHEKIKSGEGSVISFGLGSRPILEINRIYHAFQNKVASILGKIR